MNQANQMFISYEKTKLFIYLRKHTHIDGLVPDYSISIANALEILQSCTEPSIYLCFFISLLDTEMT